MSTVAEIEAAMHRLPAEDFRFLLERLVSRSSSSGSNGPKTGGELAALWPRLFHLAPAEADALAADLEAARHRQSPPRPPAWE